MNRIQVHLSMGAFNRVGSMLQQLGYFEVRLICKCMPCCSTVVYEYIIMYICIYVYMRVCVCVCVCMRVCVCVSCIVYYMLF